MSDWTRPFKNWLEINGDWLSWQMYAIGMFILMAVLKILGVY